MEVTKGAGEWSSARIDCRIIAGDDRASKVSSMPDWSSCTAVERSSKKMSGAWVFRGTRVPVKALFENLEGGATVDQFLEWFPGVTGDDALAVLRFVRATLVVEHEAQLETAEILTKPEAMKAIADYESGKTKFVPLSALEDDE